MGFLDQLQAGELGARVRFEAALEHLEELPGAALLRDPERRVAWEIVFVPFGLDLREATFAALREDVEGEARAAFDATWEDLGREEGAASRPPARTTDPTWSPVIAVEALDLALAPALRVIHRMSYQPAHEMVIGRVLVPVADGVLSIAATSLTRTTGYREAARLVAALGERQGASPADVGRELGQAGYDDPDYDLLFPDHPLSLVRAALTWLLDAEGGGLSVTAPAAPPPEGEVTLSAPSCAVTLPPRYLPLPPGRLPLSPSLTMLSRVGLAATSPRLLDVWRLPKQKITGEDREKKLANLARKNAAESAGEGATGLAVKITKLPSEGGRAHLQSHVQYVSGGRPIQAATRWMADTDGCLFRVAASAGPWVAKEALFADAEHVMTSLRRLDPPPAATRPEPEAEPASPPAKPKRKWWPFG